MDSPASTSRRSSFLGASAPVFAFLRETGLLPLIFPFLAPVAETEGYDRFLASLGCIDRDIREGHHFTEPVLVGILYWFAYLRKGSTAPLRSLVNLSLDAPAAPEVKK